MVALSPTTFNKVFFLQKTKKIVWDPQWEGIHGPLHFPRSREASKERKFNPVPDFMDDLLLRILNVSYGKIHYHQPSDSSPISKVRISHTASEATVVVSLLCSNPSASFSTNAFKVCLDLLLSLFCS